ncbi:cysteine protease StiP family protein [Cellulomonas sp. URHD0024]|uniref:cysteine protease StiP family protein n=1 Tax=Cellulomonas sp. URHD0024 TaxID=1302620 RepID=UPI0003FF419E|nr:cysteine protease StiP family protein [Cellulomonas sp. URHD0024]
MIPAPAPQPRTATRQDPLHGPQFGSYAADEVSWLLTDLSEVALEAPVEEREEAIQSGGAHYAESLPIEYQPSPAYQALFVRTLGSSVRRLATAVGVVTELALAARQDGLVLVSLARAGTPVGILMRRWAQRGGVDVPHYAVSIVRGRGIDPAALAYIADRHDPSSVLFVDGWTGKGAISRELAAALVEHEVRTGVQFSPDLAVLADPGSCVSMFGTRDDFLIASACLNSTVSGLVSRTVLNDRVLTPGQFHGAKFYAELAHADVSGTFLDEVSAQFDAVRGDVAAQLATREASDADWSGWAAVEQVSAAYGIGDVNLIKPGVGETTRVLLRRVPWKILVRTDAAPGDVEHVLQLAAERGVPVERVPDLAYTCIGLIHPNFTAGAVGADGVAARTSS